MIRSLFFIPAFLLIAACNIFSSQVYLSLINEVNLDNIPTDVIVYEDNAYILTGGSIYGFKPSDPWNINLTKYTIDGGASSLAFSGRFGYTTGNFNGIKYFDFTAYPPKYKNTIMTTGDIKKIVIDNGYIYAVNKSMGLQVYDINSADFPIYRNTQMIPGEANGIFVKDKKAYITGSSANMYIVDIGDVSKLPIVGSYNFGVSFYEAFVDGNYAYIPQGNTGVQVIDITKLPFPEWVANIFARKSAKQVVASNFYVWVADEYTVEGFYNIDAKSFLYSGNYENKSAVINRIMVYEGKYIYMLTSDKKLKVLKIDYKI